MTQLEEEEGADGDADVFDSHKSSKSHEVVNPMTQTKRKVSDNFKIQILDDGFPTISCIYTRPPLGYPI